MSSSNKIATAESPSAKVCGAEASMSETHVGAHLGEAQAGPFAVRAGVKLGAEVINGVPVVHLGPVSCSIQ